MGQTIANVFYKQRADFLEEQKERDKRLKFRMMLKKSEIFHILKMD